jgi:hypothetical protein
MDKHGGEAHVLTKLGMLLDMQSATRTYALFSLAPKDKLELAEVVLTSQLFPATGRPSLSHK